MEDKNIKKVFYVGGLGLAGMLLVGLGLWVLSQEDAETPTADEDVVEEEVGEVEIEVVTEGEGEEAEEGDTVLVHYVGTLQDGTEFDSSRERGEPFMFTLGAGMVIEGWEIGVLGMREGETRILTIPPAYGYGEMGVPNSPIGPNETLIFEVELLEINPQ